jgi:hypothetical protein
MKKNDIYEEDAIECQELMKKEPSAPTGEDNVINGKEVSAPPSSSEYVENFSGEETYTATACEASSNEMVSAKLLTQNDCVKTGDIDVEMGHAVSVDGDSKVSQAPIDNDENIPTAVPLIFGEVEVVAWERPEFSHHLYWTHEDLPQEEGKEPRTPIFSEDDKKNPIWCCIKLIGIILVLPFYCICYTCYQFDKISVCILRGKVSNTYS